MTHTGILFYCADNSNLMEKSRLVRNVSFTVVLLYYYFQLQQLKREISDKRPRC